MLPRNMILDSDFLSEKLRFIIFLYSNFTDKMSYCLPYAFPSHLLAHGIDFIHTPKKYQFYYSGHKEAFCSHDFTVRVSI